MSLSWFNQYKLVIDHFVKKKYIYYIYKLYHPNRSNTIAAFYDHNTSLTIKNLFNFHQNFVENDLKNKRERERENVVQK